LIKKKEMIGEGDVEGNGSRTYRVVKSGRAIPPGQGV
jgi:hypothetical protein